MGFKKNEVQVCVENLNLYLNICVVVHRIGTMGSTLDVFIHGEGQEREGFNISHYIPIFTIKNDPQPNLDFALSLQNSQRD